VTFGQQTFKLSRLTIKSSGLMGALIDPYGPTTSPRSCAETVSCGFRTMAQVDENCGALKFGPLAAGQVQEINKILGR
jgi:hypothetical protein